MNTLGIINTVRLNRYRPARIHDPDLLDYQFRNNWYEFSQFAYDGFEKYIKDIIRYNGKNRG